MWGLIRLVDLPLVFRCVFCCLLLPLRLRAAFQLLPAFHCCRHCCSSGIMGSSDEEEMRRVRTGRGFQTRAERAAATAGATGQGGAATREAAAAEAEAVAAALRRAACRAAAQAVISSGSSEEEDAVALSGGKRKTAAVAGEESGVDFSVHAGPCSRTEFPVGSSSRKDMRSRPFLENAAAGRPAMLQHGLQLQVSSSEVSSHPQPAGTAVDSSGDEEAILGPRPLAAARSPSSDEAAPLSGDADRTGNSSTSSSSKNSGSRQSTSSSRRERLRSRSEGNNVDTTKSTSKAAPSAAAAEEAPETADALRETSAVEWQWKPGRRPFGAKSTNSDINEAEPEGEGNHEREEEEDDDILFDQVPEDGKSATESARDIERARYVDKQPQERTDPQPGHAQTQKSATSSRERLHGDGKQEEMHEQPQQQAPEQEVEKRRENRCKDKQPLMQDTDAHGRKKKPPQNKKAALHMNECRGSEDDEVDEQDQETEEKRRELGLPLAFGCGAGFVASQGHRASGSVYIKRFSKEERSSSSESVSRGENGDSQCPQDESGSKGSAAADGEENHEVSKWKSLQLPVSLEVDIPAHSPGQISAIAVNVKANRMATGGSDGLVRLWDFQGLHLESLRSYRSFCPAEKHKVEALAFSFRHDLLLVAAGDAVCRVYSSQAAELLHTTTRGDMYIRDAVNTKGHTHTVLDCCWHPLEVQQFFTCGLDATVRLWDLNAKPYGILQTLPHVTCFKTVPSSTCGGGRGAAGNAVRSNSSDCCTCCGVSPTAANCLVVGCADGSLQLWGSLASRRAFGRPDAIVRDAHSASPVPASSPRDAADGGAAASPFGAGASLAGRPDVVGGGRGTTRDLLRRAGGVAFYSATAAQGRETAGVAQAAAQSCAKEGSEKVYGVTALRFFSDDRRLVSRGEDGSVALWDTRRFKQPVARVSLPSNSTGGRGGLCVSPEEKYVCITTQGRDPVRSGGAVQILLADLLSLVTALPIGAANISCHPNASPGAAADATTGHRTSSSLPGTGTTVQVKDEAQRRDVTSARHSSASGSRAIAKHQMRQPLRILWPQETNQLLVSCTDGSVCVLFDQEMSRKGVLLCVDAAKGSRRRQAAEQEAGMMYTQPYILVPGQLPEGFKETRDGQIVRVKPRGRERVRLFLEKQKTLIPPIPAKEGYAGANVGGGNRSQHLLRQLGLLDPLTERGEDDDDPVAALRAYAEKVESSGRESQLISRAYAATQPHAVLEFDAEEEEAAIAAAVASGAVEESDRLLQQKVRCPRCALRMCQCGYMDEQNAAATASSNKRQRV